MAIFTFPAAKIPNPPANFRAPRKAQGHSSSTVAMSAPCVSDEIEQSKLVWVWTKSKQVMTAAVERGWSSFLFPSEPRFREIAEEWSSIALIQPLFFDGSEIFNEKNELLAFIYDVSSPQQLQKLQPDDDGLDTVVINFSGEWQVCALS